MATRKRAQLAAAVMRAVPHLSFVKPAALVEDVIEKIMAALVHGEKVKLSGFATFTVRSMAARVGRNPRVPEIAVKIPPQRVVLFKPSADVLRRKVNGIA